MALTACTSSPRPRASRSEISTARLRTHLFEIAGDAYEGRGAGYPGERRACDYIAREMAAAGLRPAADGRGAGFVRTFEIAPYAPTEPFGTLTSCDVAGWLEGADPQARQEIVVVGAHHDGQGMAGQADGGRLPAADGSTSDTVWNSADDNASSVSVLLEVARVLANGPRPRRSILFLTFGAEEHAFNGSFDYVTYPSFPWERHVAMLNLEKLGRAPGQQLIAAASSTSPDWQVLLTRTNQRTGWSVESLLPEVIADTDHYPFAARGLPALTLGTAHEVDTHLPTDAPERIDFGLLTQRAQYILAFVRELAAYPQRLAWTGDLGNEPGFFTVLTTAAERARSGLAPGAGALKVSALLPGFPAEHAGLQTGDLVVRVDGEPFPAETSLQAPKTLRERLITGGPHVLDVQRAEASLRIQLGPAELRGSPTPSSTPPPRPSSPVPPPGDRAPSPGPARRSCAPSP
jgi:hypothetical protein